MMHEYIYDVRAFQWNGITRTFAQYAWNLEWMDDKGDLKAFPSMKEPFILKNFETGNEREFIYKEDKSGDWIFENAEDNITCIVLMYPF